MSLDEDYLGRLTLRQYDYLVKRLFDKRKNSDYKVAAIQAAIYNTVPRKNKKVYKPEDFLPKEVKRKTWQEQLAEVERLNMLFGGIDKRKN